MPIYMDRHDLPESVNAEEVARLHQEDLKIQHDFGCKGLTYWFAGQRKTAFCLIQAPNKQALIDMHNHAHGAVPNSIIEVDPNLVESFLGRIEDPENIKNQALPIIDDPAYRALLVIRLGWAQLDGDLEEIKKAKDGFKSGIDGIVDNRNGKQVQYDRSGLLISFNSAKQAFLAGMEIRKLFKKTMSGFRELDLKLGLHSGVPFEKESELFKETITLARRLSEAVDSEMVLSSEVSHALETEHVHLPSDDEGLRSLYPEEENFLHELMEFAESAWNRADLKVDHFTRSLGLSKAQLYRKIKSITGKSLNHFIKQYRMERALEMLTKKKGNISEVAFDTGYNSAAYFSRCFYDTYGVLPSSI